MVTTHTTFQLRGYCSKTGYAELDGILTNCARLYNAALQEWRDAYSYHVGHEFVRDKATNIPMMSKDGTRPLYNEVRQPRLEQSSVSLYSQYRELTAIRKDDPDGWGSLDVGVGRGVLKRMDLARNAFYRRVKAGETPGYPRFKAARRWKSIDLANVRAGMVKGNVVRVKGLPTVHIKPNRPLPPSEDLKSLRLVRRGRRLDVNLTYEVEKEPLPHNPASVGIDMGVKTRMALSTGEFITMAGEDEPAVEPYPAAGHDPAEILTSGEPIPRITPEGVTPDVTESSHDIPLVRRWRAVTPDVTESSCPSGLKSNTMTVTPDVTESSGQRLGKAQGHQVTPDVTESSRTACSGMRKVSVTPDGRSPLTEQQRRLSRSKKGSRRWKRRAAILANARSRSRVANRNACHRMTSDLIQRFGHIGVEALKIGNMTRSAKGTLDEPGKNVAAKSGLNRSILEQTWGIIRDQLRYKAEWAGRQFVEVDPRYTSQTCSRCGVIDASSRNGKTYDCRSCGHRMDADHNAAINILRKSLAGGNAPPPVREPA